MFIQAVWWGNNVGSISCELCDRFSDSDREQDTYTGGLVGFNERYCAQFVL